MYKQSHEFAIYYQLPEKLNVSDLLQISDEQTYHRIIRVLRLELNNALILFDKQKNIECILTGIDKKKLCLKIINIKQNHSLSPKITMLVSLLKREAFEEAIYTCVEIGANVIQPVITQKTHQKIINEKELIRLNKIVIAAAEQSKNFCFPEIKEPINFENLINILQTKTNKIYFDVQGKNILEVLKSVDESNELILMTGPEGDLNDFEKHTLQKAGFVFCSLTPTILRAQTAISLSLGAFRSIFNRHNHL